MTKISKVPDGFTVLVDRIFSKNIILNSFLTRNSSGVKDNVFTFTSVNPELLLSIAKFLKKINIPYETDEIINHIINEYEQGNVDFEQRTIQALKIKQTNPEQIEKITIPDFLPENRLTKFQNRIIAHGHYLENQANFSIPGSGKTWMAYAQYFILQNISGSDSVKKLLIICPKSAFRTWEIEFQKITGKGINIFKRITGSREERSFVFNQHHDYEIFLISYHMIRNEQNAVRDLLESNRFLLILDESHHIKDIKSQTWEAVRKIAPYAFRRMILTGTPMPNKFEDIWTQFNFLYPERNLLGSYDNFRRNVQNPNTLRQTYVNLEPYWTRIGLNELDLPQLEPRLIPVPMKKTQKRIYRTIANDILARANSTFRMDRSTLSDISSHITYLLMASTDPSLLRSNNQYTEEIYSPDGIPLDKLLDEYHQYEEPGKLDVLKTVIQSSMKNHEKIIIWCNFVGTIEKVQKMCETMGYNSEIVFGEIPQSDEDDPDNNREQKIERFRNDPSCNILIANPASLSESISLHRECHHAIYVDRTFNAAHWIQSKMRIWRYGLDPNIDTKIEILYSEGTIEQSNVIPSLQKKEENLLELLREDNIDVGGMEVNYRSISGSDTELEHDYADVIGKIRDYLDDETV